MDTTISNGPLRPHMNRTLRRPRTKPTHLFTLDRYYRRQMHIYYGIISPVISCLVITLNILLIITLIKGKFRKSTHVMIISVAIADILTGIVPLPFSIYIFSLDPESDYLTVPWCYIYDFVVKYFSQILHLTSLHLTVGMGIERFIVIAYPIKAKRICRVRNGVIFSVLIFIFSILIQCDLFTLTSFEEVTRNIKNRTVTGCLRVPKIRSNPEYILREVFLTFLPCVALIVFTVLFLKKSKEIQKWRRNNSTKESNSLERLDLIVVLIMVFIVAKETIVGIGLILGRLGLLKITNSYEELSGIAAIVFQVTSPLNFIILFSLSSMFRKKFAEIVCCCCFRRKTKPQNYIVRTREEKSEKTHEENYENTRL